MIDSQRIRENRKHLPRATLAAQLDSIEAEITEAHAAHEAAIRKARPFNDRAHRAWEVLADKKEEYELVRDLLEEKIKPLVNECSPTQRVMRSKL